MEKSHFPQRGGDTSRCTRGSQGHGYNDKMEYLVGEREVVSETHREIGAEELAIGGGTGGGVR